MWEYINKKLQNEGENALKIQSDNQMQQAYIQHLNEVDEIERLKKELEDIVENESIPEDERRKAEINLKMLQLRPLQ